MYGLNGVSALPATGVGVMAVGVGTDQGWLLSLAVAVLVVWTLAMAVRALLHLRPKREV